MGLNSRYHGQVGKGIPLFNLISRKVIGYSNGSAMKYGIKDGT
jgi:hypothetical protein